MADAISAAALPKVKTVHRPVNRKAERVFFGGMAVLLCAAVVFGFWRTYFGAGMVSARLPNGLWHVHGALFTFWMVIYAAQSALVSAHRVAWHRTLGVFGFCLTPLIMVFGILMGLDALRIGVRIGPLDPQTSLAVPLLGLAPLAIPFYLSWKARRKPDVHKRLILLATIGMVDAAFGRFPWSKVGLPPAAGAVVSLAVLVLLVVAYDLFSLRRIHRTTMWAAPLVFLCEAGAVPVGQTAAWHAFAGFLEKYVAPWV